MSDFYRGVFLVTYSSSSGLGSQINEYSAHDTEDEALEAWRDNARLRRIAKVYRYDEGKEEYVLILNTYGEHVSERVEEG